SGTPFKEMVLLQPTVHCLVSLTEFPFFITLLDDVEHVHFERVFFGSKNFDMVFVYKNFNLVPVRSDDDGSADDDDDEDDGPSWDDLEKEARASDMMRNEKKEADSDEEFKRKHKKKTAGGGGPPPKRSKH
ncbi:hypothetical protein DYB28_010436, partial [Aphanomyces astaci]